jgi:hypothetical protein
LAYSYLTLYLILQPIPPLFLQIQNEESTVVVVGVQTGDGKFHDLKTSNEYSNIIDRTFPPGFIIPKLNQVRRERKKKRKEKKLI